MRFDDLGALTASGALKAAKGPVAAIIAEDAVEVESTLDHHAARGFRTCLLFAPSEIEVSERDGVIRVDYPTRHPNALTDIVNCVLATLPDGTWVYYGYNAEYLFHPYSEHRSVAEMLAFHAEERRSAMQTYVIDAYPGDLRTAPDAVSLEDTWFDGAGYFALRPPQGGSDRHLDFFGGLRWRFEAHIEENRRRIGRTALVRTQHGLSLNADHTWSVEEYNTFACPWHHNLTAAVVSFRTAKALVTNPASRSRISGFRWENSVPFEWRARQLLELGFMEPGQWF